MEHRKRNADATTKSHGFRSREDPFTGNLEDVKTGSWREPRRGDVLWCQIPNPFFILICQS